MSSTAVALRELERHASALVDRASRGERIVITRGGQRISALYESGT